MSSLKDKNILLIVTGSIAAQKAPALKTLIKKHGGTVNTILTQSAQEFITTDDMEGDIYTNLWDGPHDENMDHIRLSREADLIVVAPASADILADKVQGRAHTLAAATLLAANKQILIVPAMNQEMWSDPAVQRNVTQLKKDGLLFEGPAYGEMACGEVGAGRMVEPDDILKRIIKIISTPKPLTGKSALVTSGPTFEPIDPVRFIGNRSSGKQGHAIAAALAKAGADVTLISGPVEIPDPDGVKTIHVETAKQMLDACEQTLPAEIAICAAAVSDWRMENTSNQKIKKTGAAPTLELTENPDILKTLSTHKKRPNLVIGFAAETQNLLENAKIKLNKKSCDWIIANNVVQENTFGSDENHVYLMTPHKTEEWPRASKIEIANKLTALIAQFFETQTIKDAAE